MLDVNTVGDAVIERLKKLNLFRSVGFLEGDYEAANHLIVPPAALLVYGGARVVSDEDGTRSVQSVIEVTIVLLVIGRNLRGNREAGKDVRALLEDVRQAVHGMKSGDIALTWKSEFFSEIRDGLCIYEQEYRYTDYMMMAKR
jgi:hypothetical protein